VTETHKQALEAAAEAGLIGPAQVEPLAQFLDARAAAAPLRAAGVLREEGAEPLRFVRNFQDVFLAIGIAVLGLGMLVWLFASMPAALSVGQGGLWGPVITAAICAAVMWGLGEAFARQRKQFFPAIAACIGFCVFVFWAVMFSYGALLKIDPDLDFERAATGPAFLGFFLAFASMMGAGLAFYWRFRLPFSLALVGAAFTGLLFVLAFRFVPEPSVMLFSLLLLLAGLILFFLGVWFDARDPARTTRFSDNGFWLHFAAAPLVLNGALGLIVPLVSGGGQDELYTIFSLNAVSATVTLIVVGFLGLVSLLINRRALIVAALLTTGVAIAVLLNSAGLGEATVAAGALVVLGGGVLILGSGWNAARRLLLARVNPEGVWGRIFPPEALE
jgi:hypothetical protein